MGMDWRECILDYKDKLVFVLKQQEDFDFDDISEMLNWTISDVRNSFKSALKI